MKIIKEDSKLEEILQTIELEEILQTIELIMNRNNISIRVGGEANLVVCFKDMEFKIIDIETKQLGTTFPRFVDSERLLVND